MRSCAGRSAACNTNTRREPAGSPGVRSIARLTARIATENPLRGCRQVHGELTKLGVTVAPSTIWEILHAAGIDPAPCRTGPIWRQFLTAQAAGITAGFVRIKTQTHPDPSRCATSRRPGTPGNPPGSLSGPGQPNGACASAGPISGQASDHSRGTQRFSRAAG